jgi:inorganic pyrophosphatase
MPGELIGCDIVGPFRVKSIHGKVYGLVFIDHCTNTPFNYAVKSKDEFSQYLQQFLIDFREMFKGYKVCENSSSSIG